MSNLPVVTFEQFQASGRDVPDLSAEADEFSDAPRGPGRIYTGDLWAERKGMGVWFTQIERGDFEGTLEQIETLLYQWGCGEVFEAPGKEP